MSTLGTWSHDLTKKYMECSTQYLLTLSCQFASAGREMVSTAVVWHLHLKHHPSLLPLSIAPSSPHLHSLVVDGALVSLLCHVHGRAGVRGRSALAVPINAGVWVNGHAHPHVGTHARAASTHCKIVHTLHVV